MTPHPPGFSLFSLAATPLPSRIRFPLSLSFDDPLSGLFLALSTFSFYSSSLGNLTYSQDFNLSAFPGSKSLIPIYLQDLNAP